MMAYYPRTEYPRYHHRPLRRTGPQPAYYSPYHNSHELDRHQLRLGYDGSDSHSTMIGNPDSDDQSSHHARRRIAVAVSSFYSPNVDHSADQPSALDAGSVKSSAVVTLETGKVAMLAGLRVSMDQSIAILSGYV